MPEFAPSEAKTAVAPITVSPAGLSCEVELYLGPDELTKVATSGAIPFTSTGASQDVLLPVAMPATEGTYHVYVDVYAGGYLIAAYQAIEDVVIAGVADIRVEDLVISPTEVNVGELVTISVRATNYGTVAGSKVITCTVT